MLSQSGAYALQAVLHLAAHGSAGPLRAAAVAQALGIPRNYTSKVLHALAREGVLASARGPRGGFVLAVAPAELTLERVVAPFEPVVRGSGCLLGADARAGGSCTAQDVCAAHERWVGIGQAIRGFFLGTTVAQLVGGDVSLPPLP